jgi:hypothetical protein
MFVFSTTDALLLSVREPARSLSSPSHTPKSVASQVTVDRLGAALLTKVRDVCVRPFEEFKHSSCLIVVREVLQHHVRATRSPSRAADLLKLRSGQ